VLILSIHLMYCAGTVSTFEILCWSV